MTEPCLITAACDGACSHNPGPGGWAYLLRFSDGRVEEDGGFCAQTTNNRMELQAALALLRRIAQEPCHPDFTIRTDSKYLINGLSIWIKTWKQKQWKGSKGKPVKNRDLWEALDRVHGPEVTFTHVKGHSGDPDNERVDTIAVAFSHGQRPALLPRKVNGPMGDLAPPQLNQLVNRLEVAQRLEMGGYGLTTTELAQLVQVPTAQLAQSRQPWTWRDWQVLPCDDGHWRLQRP